MSLELDIQAVCEDADDVPPPALLRQWVAAAVGARPVELSLRIVDEAEITQLNASYRGQHTPTNVLAFPAHMPEELGLALLGDVVICAPVVRAEAREQHKALEAHWAHMVVHGTLHLLGYDHIDDAEAEAMEAQEIAILDRLNFPDPYQTPATTC